jgi:trimethylamine--corrinoid protein Co-methyltransferase
MDESEMALLLHHSIQVGMIDSVRPSVRLLNDALANQIIDEAFEVLTGTGVLVENGEVARILLEHGATQGKSRRILIPRELVESSLASAPEKLSMFDRAGTRACVVGGDEVHFDPGSAALRLFDHQAQAEREARTPDVIAFVRLTDHLEHFHLQSTGLISSDVPEKVADAYRLFLSIVFGSKPVVTGIFLVEGFAPMYEMLTAVRGGGEPLRQKPLAIFDACPSPPLTWTMLTAQSLIDCARAGIPSELVAMPLTGATAPATITGALVQLTAENLSGVVITQCAAAGAPVIFGGSPASFDMRTGNAPMGAIETMMIDCAYAQIGKVLRLPTHAYIGLSDAKCVDAQAGLETGIGAILAALAGINVVSGGGMMDYETCQSFEKLVIDDEICAMAYRLVEGIRQRDDPIAAGLFAELAEESEGFEFLTHPHTLRWFRDEQYVPRIVDRGKYGQWLGDGKPTLAGRAHKRVGEILVGSPSKTLPPELFDELQKIMEIHGRRHGMETIPRVNLQGV